MTPGSSDMHTQRTEDVTRLLERWAGGDPRAMDRVLNLVYDEIRALAAAHLARERADHTLQPTALANEAYMRLARISEINWTGREHFLAVASNVIRRVLVDHARAHSAAKRGGDLTIVPIDDSDTPTPAPTVDLLALDEALETLARMDPRQSRIVELRFFGGLTVEQTADVLQLSPRTVKSEWRTARAWLYAQLAPERAP